MTAPALPGAAPDPAPGRNDPARLPPEVKSAINYVIQEAGMAYMGRTNTLPDASAVLRTAIMDAMRAARALGGDGEPVRWAVARNDGTLNGPDHDDAYSAAGRVARLNASDEACLRPFQPYRVVPLYTRPAATGDTGEGGARC